LMEQNKFNKYFLILISFFVIHSCQFDWVQERHIYLNKIEFGLSVRDSFKKKSMRYFSQDTSNDNYILNISRLQFKKKSFFGGSAGRPKQIEIVGQVEYSFSNITFSKHGNLEISGWIPVNENNPQAELLAQRKITEELEFLLLEDLVKEYWLIES